MLPPLSDSMEAASSIEECNLNLKPNTYYSMVFSVYEIQSNDGVA
jgi:hypothetical protein